MFPLIVMKGSLNVQSGKLIMNERKIFRREMIAKVTPSVRHAFQTSFKFGYTLLKAVKDLSLRGKNLK